MMLFPNAVEIPAHCCQIEIQHRIWMEMNKVVPFLEIAPISEYCDKVREQSLSN